MKHTESFHNTFINHLIALYPQPVGSNINISSASIQVKIISLTGENFIDVAQQKHGVMIIDKCGQTCSNRHSDPVKWQAIQHNSRSLRR